MRSCLRVFAIGVIILTVILLAAGLVVLNLRLTLLTPAFWEGLLIRQRVYAQLSDLAVDGIFEQAPTGFEEEGGGPSGSEGPSVAAELEGKFGRQAFEEFFDTLIPPAWVQQQIEQNIEAMFAWLEGETPYPYLRVDLSDIGERLNSEEGQEALRSLLSRLPPCELGEEFATQEELLPHCRPPDPALDEAMEEKLPALQERLPEDVDFRKMVRIGEIDLETLKNLGKIQQVYRVFTVASVLVWPVCLFLLALALLCAARSLDQALRWIGWPLLAAGGLAMAAVGVIFVIASLVVERGLGQLPPDASAPQALLELLKLLLRQLIRGVTGRGLLLAGGAAAGGLVALVIAALVHSASEPEAQGE